MGNVLECFKTKQIVSENRRIPKIAKHSGGHHHECEETELFSSSSRSYCHTKIDHQAMTLDPKDYEFEFENIVFEGGGNKGMAYCGVLKCLREVGILKKVKRVAGASAGAMIGALMVVGYSHVEIEDFLANNLSEIFIDHTCGYCSLLPNLLSGYGWNPGRKIMCWFGEKMMNKTGKKDITFQEVYKRYGKELCIVVTNLNQMTTEYCHPKTTPDMPVRLAVRMSMAIPGLFKAMTHDTNGHSDVYVDGGVLCNYPVHCFDGWYLSMKPGDSFIERLQPLSEIPRLFEKAERFGEYNPKTLGCLLFSEDEAEVFRYELEQRIGVLEPETPSRSTKLYRKKWKAKKEKEQLVGDYCQVVDAVNNFLRLLRRHHEHRDGDFTSKDFKAVFKDDQFSKAEIELLFGRGVDSFKAFQLTDKNSDGRISFTELVEFIEKTGVGFQVRFLGYQRKDISNFPSFLCQLQSTLLTNTKKIYIEDRDVTRTVGINTGYVDTTDFKCEEEDREFVIRRGYNATMAFLKYHAATNDVPLKSKPIRSNERV